MNKSGPQTYLNEDKESLLVASSDIEGGHGLPFDCWGVAKQLLNVSKDIKYRCGYYGIKDKPPNSYFREVIKYMNEKEDDNEYQKNSCSGLVKVPILRNSQASNIDLRLSWIMLHKIAAIYRDMKHQ